MSLGARFFRWHRWLAWLVALQVLAWLAGGMVFSWLPFKTWVKAEDSVARPQQPLPPDWAEAVAQHLRQQPQAGPVLAVASVATAQGPALRLRRAGGESWISASGGPHPPPDAAAAERFARSLYKGTGRLLQAERLSEVPVRWGIVREAPPRRALWRVSFDDALATRLYLDAASGELLAVRTEAWVWYDFFWRLHLMDYVEGEDFNHGLIRAAALAALALAITGAVLAVLALRRRWLRWRRRDGA